VILGGLLLAALAAGCPSDSNQNQGGTIDFPDLGTGGGGGGSGGGGGTTDPATLLTVKATDHVLGSESAPVTVIEYADFECPVCGKFEEETFPTIKSSYIDTGKVRWVFRHFPLRNIHPDAQNAAEASECAAAQGDFWGYHALLFQYQTELAEAKLVEYASTAGLDGTALQTCLTDGAQANRVQQDVNSGISLGVSGTPTFFINGELVSGFQTVEAMSALLDEAAP
jgi:protein-disulfide isomerase